MSELVTKIETENCLRGLLKEEGYKFNSKEGLGRLSSGIKATKDGKDWYIEVIGFKKSGLERLEEFYKAFFRSLSRLNNKNCKYIVIAMPENTRKFLPIRAKAHRVSWQRIAQAFPELEIWLVDTENRKYEKTSWIYWLEYNK